MSIQNLKEKTKGLSGVFLSETRIPKLSLDLRKILYRSIIANNPSMENIDWNNIVFKFNSTDNELESVVSLRPKDRSKYYEGTVFRFKKVPISEWMKNYFPSGTISVKKSDITFPVKYPTLLTLILKQFIDEKDIEKDPVKTLETYLAIEFQLGGVVELLTTQDNGLNFRFFHANSRGEKIEASYKSLWLANENNKKSMKIYAGYLNPIFTGEAEFDLEYI